MKERRGEERKERKGEKRKRKEREGNQYVVGNQQRLMK